MVLWLRHWLMVKTCVMQLSLHVPPVPYRLREQGLHCLHRQKLRLMS